MKYNGICIIRVTKQINASITKEVNALRREETAPAKILLKE